MSSCVCCWCFGTLLTTSGHQPKHVVRYKEIHHGLALHSYRKRTPGSQVKVQDLLDPSTTPPLPYREFPGPYISSACQTNAVLWHIILLRQVSSGQLAAYRNTTRSSIHLRNKLTLPSDESYNHERWLLASVSNYGKPLFETNETGCLLLSLC